MNKWLGIGNLTADPELRRIGSDQTAMCTFRLAVTRRVVNRQGVREADFLPVVCWKTTAENAARYLRKGSKCAVVGSVQTRSYEKDGQKHYVTEIIADEVEFLTRAEDVARAHELKLDEMPAEFVEVEDDELPF